MTTFICIHSQQDMNKIVPPSPEAAQIAKYIETPVALTNGIPDISIPLFNVSETDFNIPVVLNYHAGGIKVEEIASNVGLGWSINIGGKISRITRDRPDDQTNKGFIYNNVMQSTNLRYDIIENHLDTEADLFTFSFLNYSGSFAFNQAQGKFIQMPLSDIKINPIYSNNSIVAFKLITPDGYEYYFGKNKLGTISAVDNYTDSVTMKVNKNASISEGDTNTYINTWHLLEIYSPKGNTISFTYENTFPSEQLMRSSQSISYSSGAEGQYVNDNIPTTIYSLQNGNSTTLKKINLKKGSLEIIYSTVNREDLKYAKSIQEIRLNNSATDYLAYKFNYSYFTSSPEINNLINSYGDHYTKRLKLDFLTYNSYRQGTLKEINKYSFQYSNVQLPNRFSFAQDYWGYYNGANNNSLLPDYELGVNVVIRPNNGGASRAVNPLTAEAGTLKKIYYPTGGYTEFIYESNKASSIGFIGENRPFNLRNTLENQNLTLSKANTNYVSDLNGNRYEKPFTLNNVVGETSVNISLQGCPQGNLNSFECQYIFKIIGTDINNNPVNYTLNTGDTNLNLKSGTYKVIAEAIEEGTSTDFSIVLNAYYDPTPYEMNVGGLRIKEIKTIDNNSQPLSKKYFYDSDNLVSGYPNVYFSSGVLPTAPILLTDAKINAVLYYKVLSQSNYPTITIGKSELHYGKVVELEGDKIKIEYYFDTVGDLFSNLINFYEDACFMTNGSGGVVNGSSGQLGFTDLFKNRKEPLFTDRRGKLIKKLEYKNTDLENNTFSLINEEINTYVEKNSQVFNSFSIKYDQGGSSADSQSGSCNSIRLYTYPQQTNYLVLSKKETKNYLNGSTLLTTSNYYYDNSLHSQLTREEVIFPNGTTTKKLINYANEKGNQYLIDKNMVGIPLQTTATKNNVGISNVETKYPTSQTEANTKTNGFALPYEVLGQDLQTSTLWNKELVYSKYDNLGNILEYKINDITPVTIIWGYNQTQPLAKIEGITYNSLMALSGVSTLINDAISKSNLDVDATTEQTLLTALTSLRNNSSLGNYTITTFTYDPLIGVTSITQPNGMREIYKYDNANRLQSVVDMNGKILKEYQYNYKQ